MRSINKQNRYGQTPLIEACFDGKFQQAKNMVENSKEHIEVNIRDKQGTPAFLYVCAHGSVDFVRYMVESPRLDVDLNILSGGKRTPLHFACISMSADNAEYLLTLEGYEAYQFAKDKYGDFPVHSACKYGRDAAPMDYLVKADETKTLCNIPNDDGFTVLHLACQEAKRFDYAECLIRSSESTGIDVNLKDLNGQTALHHACKHGLLRTVKCLITNNESNPRPRIDPNIQDNDGKTPFHLAWNNRHAEVMDFLRQTEHVGLDLNVADHKGDTLFHLLFRSNDDATIRRVKQQMAPSEFQEALLMENSDGDSPLHIACRLQRILLVDFLINSDDLDVDTRTTNGKGDTLFHIAFGTEDDKMIQYLLRTHRTQMDMDAKNIDGNTLLHIAAANPASCANTLWEPLTRGQLDATIQNNEGNTVFHLAMKTSNARMVKTMLTSKNITLDIPRTNNNGDTALHLGCTGERLDAMLELLQFDVNLSTQNNDGNTPVHLAFQNKRPLILTHLLREHKDKLDLCIQNKDGNTPAHLAYKDRVIPFTQSIGNIQNNEGNTMLHHAAANNYLKIAKALIQVGGADTTIQNRERKTAIYIARRKGHYNIEELMERAGANKRHKSN